MAEFQMLQRHELFVTNIYKVLSEGDRNVLFSPVSLRAILFMAFQGAQGTTAERFSDVLHIPPSKTAAECYNEVMARVNSVENVVLLTSNRIFLMEGLRMLASFRTAITLHFRSQVRRVNFGENIEAVQTINSCVEQETRDKVKDLISEDDFDASTRLVLGNAIYFKGLWLCKFNKGATKTEPFYLNDVDTVNVQMMHTTRNFYYKNDASLNAKVLHLPYNSPDLSMIIVLPNERNGIRDVEQKLLRMSFTDIIDDMWDGEREVVVALPKFRIEQTIDLQDSLTKVGLGEIFDEEKANFRGMIELAPEENLYVSKAIQKAIIEVDEEGADPTAVTNLDVNDSVSLSEEDEIFFTVDHPFIFLLTYQSAPPLFIGKIVKI